MMTTGTEYRKINMYEKDEDEGNVGAQWKMARDVFKPKPSESQRIGDITITLHDVDYGQPSRVHQLVDAGSSEFESHEDVMAKLLGKI